MCQVMELDDPKRGGEDLWALCSNSWRIRGKGGPRVSAIFILVIWQANEALAGIPPPRVRRAS